VFDDPQLGIITVTEDEVRTAHEEHRALFLLYEDFVSLIRVPLGEYLFLPAIFLDGYRIYRAETKREEDNRWLQILKLISPHS
jgi:hypothetical protein